MENQKNSHIKWAITISMLIAASFLMYMSFIYNLPHMYDYLGPAVNINAQQKDLYTSLASYDRENQYPFIQSDIDNVFYVIEPNKDVEFFEYNYGNFSKIKSAKKMDLTVDCHGQEIPVTMSCITRNGKTLGYGNFVSISSKNMYSYAFFKLCNAPKNYVGNADFLLFVDFNNENVFNFKKQYSMIFEVNSKTKKVSKVLNSNNQAISIETGKPRDDFFIVDDDVISSYDDQILFISSRNYKQSNEAYGADVFSKKDRNTPSKLIASEIVDGFVRQDKDEIIYLQKSKNHKSGSFSLISSTKNNSKSTVLRTFDGDFKENYIRCGDFLIDKATMTLYDLVENTESVLMGISINDIKCFAVSPDKTKIIFAENLNNQVQRIVFYDLNIKRFKSIERYDAFLDDFINLSFVNNDIVSYVKPSKSTNTPFCNFIISWDKVFSTIP